MDEPDFDLDLDLGVPFWLYAIGCFLTGGLIGFFGAALIWAAVNVVTG